MKGEKEKAKTFERFRELQIKTASLLEALAGNEQRILDRPGKDGGWSVMQILSHMMQSEELSYRYVKKKLSFNPELQTIHVTISGLAAARLEGAESISADNFGQWLPYRICTSTPLIQNKTLDIHFRSHNFEHRKSTTFLTKKR